MRLGRDVRQIGAAVQHQRQRISHDRRAGAGLDRLGRQMPAEGARAGHGAEQAEHVAGDGVQPHALGQFALDIGDQRQRGLLGRRNSAPPRRTAADRRRAAATAPDRRRGPSSRRRHARAVSGACSSVAMPPLSTIVEIADARALSRCTMRIIERRHVAVFPRRQALAARPCAHARSARRRRPP